MLRGGKPCLFGVRIRNKKPWSNSSSSSSLSRPFGTNQRLEKAAPMYFFLLPLPPLLLPPFLQGKRRRGLSSSSSSSSSSFFPELAASFQRLSQTLLPPGSVISYLSPPSAPLPPPFFPRGRCSYLGSSRDGIGNLRNFFAAPLLFPFPPASENEEAKVLFFFFPRSQRVFHVGNEGLEGGREL